jgi:hypothetical protein
MMDALEKQKYFRSRPSRAWQSAQRARISGDVLNPPELSGAFSQSCLPARIESGSRRGGVQVWGSSWMNEPGASTGLESPVRKIEGKDAKSAHDSIRPIEAEANSVGAVHHGIRWEQQVRLQRRETTANSAVALAGFGDGNRTVVQGQPVARIHLNTGHIWVSQTMDLHP